MDDTQTLPAKEPLQISLTKRSTVRSALIVANELYNLNANPDDYEDRITYKDKNGDLSLDVVSVHTGELCWILKDRYTTAAKPTNYKQLEHPKDFGDVEVVNNFSVIIGTEGELDFLKGLALNEPNANDPLNFTARTLADLLNVYGVGDGWSTRPNAGLTTAYFVLRYIGPGADAPEVYNFNRNTKCLAVVELMMYGEYKTHALVVG